MLPPGAYVVATMGGLRFDSAGYLLRSGGIEHSSEAGTLALKGSQRVSGRDGIGSFEGVELEWNIDSYRTAFRVYEKGAIVLVSGAPARRAKPGQAALASVGGAVEQFARAVAPELAPRRINVVSPGVIDTPMFGPDAQAREKMLGAATANNLIPRAGTPDEVAEAVMFVAGNEFVTGTTVEVDGGWILS